MKEEEMLIEELEKFLKFQFVLSMQVVYNVEYINKHLEEANKSPSPLLNREYLNYIGRLISDDTIISLYKLFNSKEHYSFHSLIRKINLLKSKGYGFKDEKHFDYFKTILKEMNMLYNKMNANEIRNKYIGHLDSKRNYYHFDIEILNLITEKLKVALNQINIALFYSSINIENDKNKLAKLIDDNILLKTYLLSENDQTT